MKPTADAPNPTVTRNPRTRRTRRALQEALLALMRRRHLDQITVRDIAEEAAVGYATFFRHYTSKGQLLEEIAAAEIAQLVERAGSMLDSNDVHAACLSLCNLVYEHRALWAALLTGGAAVTLRDEFIRLVVQKRSRKSRKATWLPTELGAVFGVGATIEIIGWWLKKPEELTSEEVATVLERLVVTPTLSSN